jgi:hypothetical protein
MVEHFEKFWKNTRIVEGKNVVTFLKNVVTFLKNVGTFLKNVGTF